MEIRQPLKVYLREILLIYARIVRADFPERLIVNIFRTPFAFAVHELQVMFYESANLLFLLVATFSRGETELFFKKPADFLNLGEAFFPG